MLSCDLRVRRHAGFFHCSRTSRTVFGTGNSCRRSAAVLRAGVIRAACSAWKRMTVPLERRTQGLFRRACTFACRTRLRRCSASAAFVVTLQPASAGDYRVQKTTPENWETAKRQRRTSLRCCVRGARRKQLLLFVPAGPNPWALMRYGRLIP